MHLHVSFFHVCVHQATLYRTACWATILRHVRDIRSAIFYTYTALGIYPLLPQIPCINPHIADKRKSINNYTVSISYMYFYTDSLPLRYHLTFVSLKIVQKNGESLVWCDWTILYTCILVMQCMCVMVVWKLSVVISWMRDISNVCTAVYMS